MGSILYGGADANGGGAAAAPVEPGLSPLELKARLVTPKPKIAMLYQQLESWNDDDYTLLLKCNFPMNPHVRLLVGWLVCWLVASRSVIIS